MFVRSDGAWNPLDPKNNHRTEILQRILTNTVEQFLLTVGSTIILSTYLKPSQMIIIPIFVILWCLGRIVFELRYVKFHCYSMIFFYMHICSTYIFLQLQNSSCIPIRWFCPNSSCVPCFHNIGCLLPIYQWTVADCTFKFIFCWQAIFYHNTIDAI